MGNEAINRMPKNPTDRRIKGQVNNLLHLRHELDVNTPAGAPVAMMIVGGAVALFRELVRPAAPVYGVGLDPNDYAGLSREEIRTMAAVSIREGFPLPDGLTDLLSNALDDLNAGGSSWILDATPGRRGDAPDALAIAQLQACLFVRCEHAKGRTVREVREEVCNKIGRSFEAVSKWQLEMAKLHGKTRFAGLCKAAEQLGGSKKALPIRTAIEMNFVFEVRGLLKGGLPEIVALFRAATNATANSS
jgi:hypothetical protein